MWYLDIKDESNNIWIKVFDLYRENFYGLRGKILKDKTVWDFRKQGEKKKQIFQNRNTAWNSFGSNKF